MKTDHLLIMRFSALGEVTMLVPVVSSLASQYPDLRITVLSRPFARPLFDGLAPNVGFMEADLGGEYHGVKGLNALFRRLVAKNFTAIADMHNILRSSYLRMRFNLGHFRVEHIDKHRHERRLLTSQRDRHLSQLPSIFEDYADVLGRLGYPVKLDYSSAFPPLGGSLRLLDGLVGDKKPFQQWIGLALFSQRKAKALPASKTEKVIVELVRRHPSCRIFMFGGGPGEMEYINVFCNQFKNCINATAMMPSVQHEMILMSHLDVMVAIDGANMHLASVVGTRVVSVWGATHPYAGFLGWGQAPSDCLQIDMPCRPCSIYGNRACLRGDYACLNSINPMKIVEKIEEAIARPRVVNEKK